MNAQIWDWIGVGLAVAGAALWLALRLRRNWKAQKEAKEKGDACGSRCEGCPFAKGCDGKSHPSNHFGASGAG
ncbi:MAG TPA: hypothetical protein DCM68_07755 [Verrucomicrobia bacterium]|nr:hypothetical protein [Verrucomicrobiota bacterium]